MTDAHSSPLALHALRLVINSVERPFFIRPGTSDEGVLTQVFRNQDYNLERLRRYPSLMQYANTQRAAGRRPFILDAGANIGAASVYFATVHSDAHVFAVEPSPKNFAVLRRNVQGLRVDGRRAALASRSGTALLTDPGEGHWGYRAIRSDDAAGDNTTACVAVNDIYRSLPPGQFPFIVKIDIEGAEAEVFSANTEWVSKTPLLIVELHDWLLPGQGTALPFLRCVSSLQRDFVHIGENIFSISNNLEALLEVRGAAGERALSGPIGAP